MFYLENWQKLSVNNGKTNINNTKNVKYNDNNINSKRKLNDFKFNNKNTDLEVNMKKKFQLIQTKKIKTTMNNNTNNDSFQSDNMLDKHNNSYNKFFDDDNDDDADLFFIFKS